MPQRAGDDRENEEHSAVSSIDDLLCVSYLVDPLVVVVDLCMFFEMSSIILRLFLAMPSKNALNANVVTIDVTPSKRHFK